MRFDRHTRSAPYLNRSDQVRMLRMVGLLALVILLIQVAAKPESWNWFFALSEPPPGAASAEPPELKPVQIRHPEEGPELPDDTYYARVTGATEGDPDSASTGAGELPTETPNLARLPDQLLESVQDDWFGLTRAEQPALVAIAQQLREQANEELGPHADPNVTFDVLLKSPGYYRGRLMTLSGTLRRLLPAEFSAPDGPVRVYEGYVVPGDSRGTPYLVFLNDLPTGIAPGDGLEDRVEFEAYFIRRFAYPAQKGEEVTAMLFAPTLRRVSRTGLPPAEVRRELESGMVILFSVIGVVVLGLVVWFIISDLKFRRSRLHAIAESRLDADPNALAELGALDGGDPHQIRVGEMQETPRP